MYSRRSEAALANISGSKPGWLCTAGDLEAKFHPAATDGDKSETCTDGCKGQTYKHGIIRRMI